MLRDKFKKRDLFVTDRKPITRPTSIEYVQTDRTLTHEQMSKLRQNPCLSFNEIKWEKDSIPNK